MEPLALHPLAHRARDLIDLPRATGGGVDCDVVPFLAQIALRLDPDLAERAPIPLPLEPNTTWEEGPRAALWLGPDEWIILGPADSAAGIVADLDRALEGLHRSVVDVSANRVVLELAGPDRLALLATGCPIDLHPRAWEPGRCAQTLFGRAPVILHERTDATRILVRPSFADYVVDRLLAGAFRHND